MLPDVSKLTDTQRTMLSWWLQSRILNKPFMATIACAFFRRPDMVPRFTEKLIMRQRPQAVPNMWVGMDMARPGSDHTVEFTVPFRGKPPRLYIMGSYFDHAEEYKPRNR